MSMTVLWRRVVAKSYDANICIFFNKINLLLCHSVSDGNNGLVLAEVL